MHPLSLYQFEYRLALALALGAVLGLERQVHHKAAGTKTHALVALGAALFVLLAEGIPGDASAPGRVAGQIITGIGFLGAGAILRSDSSTVTGLTTAATVWCAGAIGTLAGLGSWYQALIGTGFILVANVLLRPLDLFINRLGQPKRALPKPEPVEVPVPEEPGFRVHVAVAAQALTQVLMVLLPHQPRAVLMRPTAATLGTLWVRADLFLPAPQLAGLLGTLQALPGVAQVRSETRPVPAPPRTGGTLGLTQRPAPGGASPGW